ncbi:MAG TPA: DUF3857 domain-containing protein [Ferruginibacter sp.]|nr:DUF3857 domain-containing protein [Ferruginibacter sp.]
MNFKAVCFSLFFLCLQLNAALAQLSPFAQVSDKEIQLKECSFDTDADVVVLLDEAHSDYDDRYQLLTRRHIRLKILKEKGVADANISLQFYSKDDFEYITEVKAVTINAGAGGEVSTNAVDRKSIFTRKINERVGEVSFSFPAVKVGSILEYEYLSTMKHYGGLQDWYFQETRPVITSRYNLVIVPNTEFIYQVWKKPDLQVTVTPKESTNSVYFEMNNIPGLRNEPYIDSRRDYLQKVVFQLSAYGKGNGFGGNKYMTSWDEVARELRVYDGFGSVIGKTIPGTDEFINSVKAIPDGMVKMKTVYDFVRSNMGWNGVYSRFAFDGLKSPWQKKTGNSGEINFILLNLLVESGLEVYPSLVSERWHGRINTEYPFIDQFNSVVACVKINGKNYYLDATKKFTPAHIIPYELLNTTAFVLKGKKGELVNILNDSLGYKEIVFNKLKVLEDGSIEGDTKVSSIEYARTEKKEEYTDKQPGFLRNLVKDEKIQVEIKKATASNEANDSLPFEQDYHFISRAGAAGEYLLIPVNLFSGFTYNPFLSQNRFSNINFGYKRSITILTDIVLPEGMVPEELPKSMRLTNEEKDIVMTRSTDYNENDHLIRAMIKIEFSRSLYQADEYEVLQLFYKKMFEYMDEQVLLKKK